MLSALPWELRSAVSVTLLHFIMLNRSSSAFLLMSFRCLYSDERGRKEQKKHLLVPTHECSCTVRAGRAMLMYHKATGAQKDWQVPSHHKERCGVDAALARNTGRWENISLFCAGQFLTVSSEKSQPGLHTLHLEVFAAEPILDLLANVWSAWSHIFQSFLTSLS